MNRMCLLLTLGIVSVSCLADWPQYQGANRDGVSAETVKLADSWPADGPKVAWTCTKLWRRGFGGPVVQGGQVFVLDRVEDKKDVLLCLDLKTGEKVWDFSYEAVGADGKGVYKNGYNGSRNMPVVDDKNVYILSPFGQLQAISKEKHEPVWTKNLVADYGAEVTAWGLCQSPMLYKNMLIVAPLSKQAGVLALDKETGKEVWKSERIGDMAWTSPAVVTLEGIDQVVMVHTRGQPRLTGLDAATGKKLWDYSKWEMPNPFGLHTYCGKGQFLLSGGYASGCVMVQVKKDGDTWQTSELFRNKDCGAQAVMPVCYKDFIYANSTEVDPKTKKGNGLMCMGLDGKVKWAAGNDNPEENGSVLIADGKVYQFSSEKCTLTMAAASPDGYKELGKFKVGQGTNLWAPMCYSDGKLLLRYNNTLVCFDMTVGKE